MMMKKNRLKVLAAGLIFNSALLLGTSVQAQVPSAIEYSGKISNEAGPIDGTGYFKFALVDSEGAILWSNSSVAEGETAPSEAETAEITEGVYAITLGDSENPISASVFAEDGVKLQVWFTDAEDGEFELVADAAVNPVPTAILAGNATTAATATTATTAGTAATATFANSIALVDADGEPIVGEDGEQIIVSSEELGKIATFRSNSLPHYDGATEYGMIKEEKVNWSVPFDVPVSSVAFSDDSSIPGVTFGTKGTSNITGAPTAAGEYSVTVSGTNAAGASVDAVITFKVGNVSIADEGKVKAYIADKEVNNNSVKIFAGGDVDLTFTPTADIPLTGYKWAWGSKEATVAAPAEAGDAVTYTIGGIGNDTLQSGSSYTSTYQASALYGIGDNAKNLGANGAITLTVNAGYKASVDPAFPIADQNPGLNSDLSVSVKTSAEDGQSHNYTYQWQYNDAPSGTAHYVDIDGATSSSLKLEKFYDSSIATNYTLATPAAGTTPFLVGAETGYQCVVFDGYYKMATAPSSLAVASEVGAVTISGSANIKAGTQETLSVAVVPATSASGETITYQWMKPTALNSNGTAKTYGDIANAVGGSYKTGELTSSSTNSDLLYRVVAKTAYGTNYDDHTVTVVNNWAHERSAVAIAPMAAAPLANGTQDFAAPNSDGPFAVVFHDASGPTDAYVPTASPLSAVEAAGDYFVIALQTYIDTPDGVVTVSGTDMTSNPRSKPTITAYIDSGIYAGLDSTDYQIPALTAAPAAGSGIFVSVPDKDKATKNQIINVGGSNYATTLTTLRLTVGATTHIDTANSANTTIAADSTIYIKITSDDYSKDSEYITINL